MKLKNCTQTTAEKYQEFDLWITPSLSEIKDTDKYNEELQNIKLLFEVIGKSVSDFSNLETATIEEVVKSILNYANQQTAKNCVHAIQSSISLLFLVTGKSDNNLKCQFPLYLRDISKRTNFPKIKRTKGQKSLEFVNIPREIKSIKIAKLLTELKDFPIEQTSLFKEYIGLILNDDCYKNSLWAIGQSYFKMKNVGIENDFLMPLVVFKVRGSVSAIGGHNPEELLRELMSEWGLTSDEEFNLTDVIIGKETSNKKVKTRAYDFVLPHTLESSKKLLIQCQFYAGDSGSVSHKNVDQTRASRNFTKSKITQPLFIEYLDGAGYFSSLNGDLKSILSMEDTFDFFQIRTAPIKLRRLLQHIGFLTPLELVHSLVINNLDINSAKIDLFKAGYTYGEIKRVLSSSLEKKIILKSSNKIVIENSFLKKSRKYFLLDIIFNNSHPVSQDQRKKGMILVPGLNGLAGISLSQVLKNIIKIESLYSRNLRKSKNLLADLEKISELGWVINS